MAAWYGWIQLVHLACAIVFVGAVAFEVLVVESFHRQLAAAEMARIEDLILSRARRFMPLVVLLLFVSGFAMYSVRCPGFGCIDSRFGVMLNLKVLLAFGVLAVFVSTLWAALRGRMSPCRFRYTHRIVLGLMVGIVFLARAMFLL